jgi:hypothetical protein
MMLVANDHVFGTPTGWIENCGDAEPTDMDGYVLVPYPANSDTYLDATSTPYKKVPKAQVGPAQYVQLKAKDGAGVLECQGSGARVIQCVTGLK